MRKSRATIFWTAMLFLTFVIVMSYSAATAFPGTNVALTAERIESDITYCKEFPVYLNINGKMIDSDVPPVIVNGRTLVPVRTIFEGIGADVDWDEETRQVAITMDGKELSLEIDSRAALIDDSEVTLDVPAMIIDGRTMIPVRFAAESLGFGVDWDDRARTVKIKAPDQTTAVVEDPEPVPGGAAGGSGSDFPSGGSDIKDSGDGAADDAADDNTTNGTDGGDATTGGDGYADPGNSSTDAISLPAALLANDLKDPAQALANFLNTCSGKEVVFPADRTYVLEKQLVIHDVSGLQIDFNGCTFKLPDNCSIPSRSDTGHYVPENTAVVVHDVSDLTISNYTIDGNKAHISSSTWCTGLAVMNADGFESNNGSFKNSNYHQIIIGPTNVSAYNTDIVFRDTFFKDHGGASGGAGISDVYVSNRITDDFSFIDVTVDNTSLKEYSQQAQCFYIAGHNGYFENVDTNNCAVPLDVRYGKHTARNFTVNNAEMVLMLQPYPGGNGSNGYADVTASNFKGRNIQGSVTGGATGVYVIGCDSCHLDDFDIEMDPTSPYAWYGIRIRKFYSQFPISDVEISNSTITGFKTAGLRMEGLNESAQFSNIELTSASSGTYGVMTATCTAYQYLTGLVTTNCTEASSSDSMLKLL